MDCSINWLGGIGRAKKALGACRQTQYPGRRMLVFKKIPEELDLFNGDIVLAVVGADERPLKATNAWLDWRLYGTLSELITRGVFKASLGEQCMIPTYGRLQFDRLVLLGGGNLFQESHLPAVETGEEYWAEILKNIESTVQSLKVSRVGLSLPRFDYGEQEKALLEIVRRARLPENLSLFLSRASSYATPLGV